MKWWAQPFTRQNRPWLTDDCIEAMNQQYKSCMSKIPPDLQEALSNWAAVKVEMHATREDPKLRGKFDEYAATYIGDVVEKIEASFPSHRKNTEA
jgi:hypothetical protein